MRSIAPLPAEVQQLPTRKEQVRTTLSMHPCPKMATPHKQVRTALIPRIHRYRIPRDLDGKLLLERIARDNAIGSFLYMGPSRIVWPSLFTS